MFLIVLVAVLGSVFSDQLPAPRAQYHSGVLEIAVEGVPDVVYNSVTYTVGDKEHHGPLHQAADGRWYHRNAVVDGKPKHYKLVAEAKGEVIVREDLFEENTEVAIAPPQRIRRAGHVVFRDDFSSFNPAEWDTEVSMYGGYNWEIQAYTNDKKNVFTKDGALFLKPTLTTDDSRYSESTLHTGVMDMTQLFGTCTNSDRYGCHREGQNGLLPPVWSGKIKSKKTIRFGTVEVRAKIPRGDWLWPAIWMLPRNSEYGGWPRSGEIDMMESRGNDGVYCGGKNVGVNHVSSTMHWGPSAGQNKYQLTTAGKDGNSFWNAWHTYKLEWTESQITTFVDNNPILSVPTNGGYWQKGGFSGGNIWAGGARSAPFDKDFYLILNVAVGGTNGFFPDGCSYDHRKPWNDRTQTEPADFWNAKNSWYPTWHGDDAAMRVDWVQMTQY